MQVLAGAAAYGAGFDDQGMLLAGGLFVAGFIGNHILHPLIKIAVKPAKKA